MTIRKTSIEAYRQIKEEGLLSRMRFLVYEIIYEHGPLTIAEASTFVPKIDSRSISPRFAELLNIGVIETIGEKTCNVTGRNSTLWDVTEKLPKKLTKPTKIKCKYCGGKGYVCQEKLI